MLLQIGAADPATQVSGQGGDDAVKGLRHRRKRVIGSEDNVVVAEYLDRCVQRSAVIGQAVAPQSSGQPTR